MRAFILLLLMFATSSCAGRAEPPVPPSYHRLEAPVDLTRQQGRPLLPWIRCLIEQGSSSSACLSLQPSLVPGNVMPTATR